MSDIQDQPGSGGSAGPGTAPGTAPGSTQGRYVPRPTPGYDDVRAQKEGPSGLAMGLTLVAAVFMMIGGLFDFFEGLAALIRGQFFVVLPNYAFSVSVTGWGWLHLITGVVVFVTGVALLTDRLWARVVGVVVAGLSAVMNFVMLPYQPVWAIVVIALDIAIIAALCAPRRH